MAAGLRAGVAERARCWYRVPAVLLARPVLEGIWAGQITLVFRRWLRPSVRAGGTLKTAIGVLAIEDVAGTTESQIDEADARAAGYPDRATLLAQTCTWPAPLKR